MSHPLHLALIEDSRFHALLFERVVAETFPQIQIATFNGARNFAAADHPEAFDLFVIDMMLSDIDPVELLQELKEIFPARPLLAIIDTAEDGIAAQAGSAGADALIVRDEHFAASIPRALEIACRLEGNNNREGCLPEGDPDDDLDLVTAMAATLNHEINNPLMAIRGAVEILLDQPEVSSLDIADKLRIIDTQARRIQEITRSMSALITPTMRQTPVGPMLYMAANSSVPPIATSPNKRI